MKHAILSPTRDEAHAENCVEVELADGRTGYLTEAEYSEDELRAFESAAPECLNYQALLLFVGICPESYALLHAVTYGLVF